MEDYKGESSNHNAITSIARLSIDIDGHYQPMIYAYVAPRLGDGTDMILGTPWMKHQQANVESSGPRLQFADGRSISMHDKPAPMVTRQVNAAAIVAWSKRQRKGHRVQIFAASLKDIEKALQVKQYTDPRTKLPLHYHEFLHVFDRDKADQLPPHREGADHKIELLTGPDGKELEVPWGPLYNMSRDELLVLRKTLTELLDKNFIRLSYSSAAAPVLFARKPGGGLRFCTDYRALNAITKKDRYPLPLINETLERISKAKWFTKLDVIAAFHKIRIHPGDEWKTAFRTRFGLYEWLVTPFGLANAPSTFQRYINWTLRDFLDEFASAYLDDVLIFTDGSLKEHRKHVRQVLEKLGQAGLQLDIDKCEFEVKSTKYLGFILDAEKGIRMDPGKVKAILEWQTPTSVKGVRSFLGFANFYRRFIRNFSDLVRPLTDLTLKGARFLWTTEHTTRFEQLKRMFATAPILMQFDPDRETVFEADASNWATGGLISQYDNDGVLRPCAYYSKKNSPAECNYEIHDKELLAIINGLKEWESELMGLKEFTIVTDHKNLRYFATTRRLNERQMRWADTLSRFNFHLKYRPGKLAARPDALSRREQDMPSGVEDDRLKMREQQLLALDNIEEWSQSETDTSSGQIQGDPADQSDFEDIVDLEAATKLYRNVICRNNRVEDEYGPLEEQWETAWRDDDALQEATKVIKEGGQSFPSKLRIRVSPSECSVSPEGHLLFRSRRWVPASEPLRTRILEETHSSGLTGHPGRNSLYAMVARNFFWPDMSKDVRRYVANCDECGANAVWRDRRQGLLKPLPIPDRKWREISIDFVVKLPTSQDCEDLMVITDRLSKGVILVPCEKTDSEAVAQLLITHFIGYHGIPSAITSDRGTQFTSQVWEYFCKLLGIKRRLSTAFHPQTDGQTERMNAVIEQYLRHFCNYAQDDWVQWLPLAQLAINGRDAASTGVSPFFLDHGYNVEPLEIERLEGPPRPDDLARTPKERGERIALKLKDTLHMAISELAAAQQRQEEYSNRYRNAAPKYKVNQKVWLDLRNVRTGRPSKKLDSRHAKFTVTEVINSHAYRLDTPPGIYNVFHTTLLRPAADAPFPSQRSTDYQPPAVMVDNNEEYFVEEITDERERPVGRGYIPEVLVKWLGYRKLQWQPRANFEETEALDIWEQRVAAGEVTPTGRLEPRARRPTRRRGG
jgi:transposase InsO family protein